MLHCAAANRTHRRNSRANSHLPMPARWSIRVQITVRQYIEAWLGLALKIGDQVVSPPGLSPKTAERYRELAVDQIFPYLGSIPMQKLKPGQIAEWHEKLLAKGSKRAGPLSARTVGHAHRVLHRALERAVERERLNRNVASVIKPPKVDDRQIQILDPDGIELVLRALEGNALHPIVDVAIATGLRRGELIGLPWSTIDLDAASLRVERAAEETKLGLRLKPPKSRYGRRTISFPASTAAVLREHRRKQLETRLSLGLGRPDPDALVFCRADGSLLAPSWLSYTWRNTCESLNLPTVTFHALRHTHASALIAANIDVVAISRRLGHSSPAVTLRVYAHLFNRDDDAAVTAIEAVMRTQRQR